MCINEGVSQTPFGAKAFDFWLLTRVEDPLKRSTLARVHALDPGPRFSQWPGGQGPAVASPSVIEHAHRHLGSEGVIL